MLKADGLESGYGPMQVLWGASLEVHAGSITALLGANGAGKTTLLRTIFGTVRPRRGRIWYDGDDVTGLPSHLKVARGLVLVPEGRHLFPDMTTRANLLMGAYQHRARQGTAETLELVYALFPVLRDRLTQPAGTLSGGEQQMLTIARGLMSRPRLMMLDEPSQGLAPKLVGEVFQAIRTLRDQSRLTILLVEQNAEQSLALADYAYVMHEGRILTEGPAAAIRESEIRSAYLGI